jgi:hypothetical protein
LLNLNGHEAEIGEVEIFDGLGMASGEETAVQIITAGMVRADNCFDIPLTLQQFMTTFGRFLAIQALNCDVSISCYNIARVNNRRNEFDGYVR